jgi:hypothetical protein
MNVCDFISYTFTFTMMIINIVKITINILYKSFIKETDLYH